MKNELCPISESSLKKHRNDVGAGLIQDDFKPVWDVSRLRKPYLKPFVLKFVENFFTGILYISLL